MKIKSIEMDKKGLLPQAVTVRMTAREAALIVRMVGKTSHSQRDQIQSDGGSAGSCIYDTLAGDLFNRFYDDGVDEVKR